MRKCENSNRIPYTCHIQTIPYTCLLCIIAHILMRNVNPLEFRGQWGHSGTNKISWIIVYVSISEETKTSSKLVPRHNVKISSKTVYEGIHLKIYLQ